MTIEELYRLLQTLSFPVAYHHFEEGHSPAPPFMVYLVVESENFGADNWSYQKQLEVHIELYTAKKDRQTEDMVESVLDDHHFYFEKVESYITSEKLYRIRYKIYLIGG